jgi:hypothetical protein
MHYFISGHTNAGMKLMRVIYYASWVSQHLVLDALEFYRCGWHLLYDGKVLYH